MKSEFIDIRRCPGKTARMNTTNAQNPANTEILRQAMTEVLANGNVTALESVLGEGFVHHRPDSTSSKEEWIAAVRHALTPLAEMRFENLHLLADGDYVVMHSRRWLPGAGPGIVVIDIWRFADGRIVEAWEIIEPIAEASGHLAWWEPRDDGQGLSGRVPVTR